MARRSLQASSTQNGDRVLLRVPVWVCGAHHMTGAQIAPLTARATLNELDKKHKPGLNLMRVAPWREDVAGVRHTGWALESILRSSDPELLLFW